MGYFYAVAKGWHPGIYDTWAKCKAEVHEFPNPVYRKFPSKTEAENFVVSHNRSALKTKSTNETSTTTFAEKNIQEDKNVAQRLSNLEKILLGHTTSTELTVSNRIKMLEHKLTSLTNELNNIKRYMSTSSIETTETPPSRKRKKTKDTDEDDIAEVDTGAFENLFDNAKELGSEYQFDVDSEGFVNVYTDGACSRNGQSGAAAGIGVWFGDNHPLNVSQSVTAGSRSTNNLAEIQAVTIAAKQAAKAGIKKLKVNTDSKFLISCITQWMPKWKNNGWKKADGQKVINKEELIEMENAIKSLVIAWNHVNGHVGIHGNEMADKLARAGAASVKKK